MDAPSRPIVLVVEDEPLLRLNALDILQDAGFDTIDVGSADQALGILIARSDIRVVFTDIDMPGSMDGMKLAAAVRDRWPPIEIIITSGHKVPTFDELPARSVFLPKPYSDDKLIRTVTDFLSGQRQLH